VIDLKVASAYELRTRGNEVDVIFTAARSSPEAKTESEAKAQPAMQAASDASASAAVLSNSDQPSSTNSATASETDTTVVTQSPTGAGTGSGTQTSQPTAQQETSHPQGKGPFASQQPQPAGADKPPKIKKTPVSTVDTRWRTNTLEGVPQFGYHLWDTYNQNRIKGD
jgi:hypothetical protein